MDTNKKITHEGEIVLGGATIPCYVLEDGTRILSSMAMQNALKMSTEGGRFLEQKSLEPFIYKEKTSANYAPIICYKVNQKINGHEATTLADICDTFLEARKTITLSPRRQYGYLAPLASLSVIACLAEYLSLLLVWAFLWYIRQFSRYSIPLIRSPISRYFSFLLSGLSMLSMAIIESVIIKIGSPFGKPLMFCSA